MCDSAANPISIMRDSKVITTVTHENHDIVFAYVWLLMLNPPPPFSLSPSPSGRFSGPVPGSVLRHRAPVPVPPGPVLWHLPPCLLRGLHHRGAAHGIRQDQRGLSLRRTLNAPELGLRMTTDPEQTK